MFKVGFITVIGRPNAGKSSLVNKFAGFKVSIITPKPQTTRFNVKGIITDDDSQMIFIDTPGIHTPHDRLGRYMMDGVSNALKKVDVVIYLVDASKPKLDTSSEEMIKALVKSSSKVILAINKIDKVKKDYILKIISDYDSYIKTIGGSFDEVVPISVFNEDGLDVLKSCIKKYLPEGEKLYLDDDITDMTEREIVEEIIREKALNNLEDEVPHGIKVELQKFKKRKNREKQAVYDIEVDIICEKSSHKGIIIGKDGLMLKKIATYARYDIEKMLEDKVNLKLWVKVRPKWQNDEKYLTNIKNKTQS